MNDFKKKVTIHFILKNKLHAQKIVYHIPRVGDEIRLLDERFYTVKKIVWVYDEPDHVHSRVNIEIKKAI
jgi:hypothetical protein